MWRARVHALLHNISCDWEEPHPAACDGGDVEVLQRLLHAHLQQLRGGGQLLVDRGAAVRPRQVPGECSPAGRSVTQGDDCFLDAK